ARDLDGGDPCIGEQGLRIFSGKVPGQVRRCLRVLAEGSGRAVGVLRFSSRALEALEDDEPNRINVRNDPIASSSNKGKRHQEDEPGHDVQAGQSRSEEMAAAERPRASGPLAPRESICGWLTQVRRLIPNFSEHKI